MLDMVIHGPKAQCMQLSSPLAGYLDATARAFMETSSGVVCRAALTAGLCAMLILMPAKMLWLFLITHLNLRERERWSVYVVRFVIYSCYSEFK